MRLVRRLGFLIDEDGGRAGVTLLKHYLLRYRGDKRRVLAAYYQGQAAVDRHGIFPVSESYIASILLLEEMLQP